MSLKWKVSALITVTTAAILLVINMFVYYQVTKVTEDRVMDYLLEKGKRLAERIQPNTLPHLDKQIASWIQEFEITQGIQVVRKDGTILFESQTTPDSVLIGEANAGVCAETGVPLLDDVMIRIYDRAEKEEIFLSNLRMFLIIGSLIGIGLCTIVSYVIAGVAISPLRRIIQQIQGIGIDELDQRLAEPKSKDELHQLTQSFNRLIHRLQGGVEQLKQFISDASHELRTPIATIEGHANLIKRWGKDSKEVLDESIDYITSEARRMKHLTNQLLQLAYLEQNQPLHSFEPTDVTSMVSDIKNQLIPLHPRIELAIRPTAHPILAQIPADTLQQVLLNVVNNAIKYTLNGDWVHIEVNRVNQNVFIHVRDNGIGIPAEDLPYIFERFYRVDKSRSREYGGSGLGLAITKKLTELYGGEISVQSIPDEGSTFSIRLPLEAQQRLISA
ncbi:HAMP domain-containing histidine kinase [Paenibacillus oenotherae]|uniref:histidine kinase n=1 Tax=Paenibacillus oenotherae TaxID=1435645 RepID=A0ABS7D7E5_9BACL|nr:HAMP domain-containing sensor histidine kinase [Paenibacillus oenotherae]MBW7475867.1 HAMP domain-containing histidine kinase [Paenibacillus oenotherae]